MLTGDRGDPQLVGSGRQRDHHDARVEQVAKAVHDQVERRSRSVSVASAFPTSISDSSRSDQRVAAR